MLYCAKLGLIFSVVLMAVSFSTPDTSAQNDEPQSAVQERAMTIIDKYASDPEKLEQALTAEGWEKATVRPVESTASTTVNGQSIGIETSRACLVIEPSDVYRQSDGSQAVMGYWSWNRDAYNCDRYSPITSPEDAFALGLTDGEGNSVDVPSTNAQGWAEDTFGNRWDDEISAVSFNGSSVGYKLNDFRSLSGYVGHKGGIYFFLDRKPTTPEPHYLEMCWHHTWNDENSRVQNVTIGYPFSFGITIENDTNTRVIPDCQRVGVTYPNG